MKVRIQGYLGFIPTKAVVGTVNDRYLGLGLLETQEYSIGLPEKLVGLRPKTAFSEIFEKAIKKLKAESSEYIFKYAILDKEPSAETEIKLNELIIDDLDMEIDYSGELLSEIYYINGKTYNAFIDFDDILEKYIYVEIEAIKA